MKLIHVLAALPFIGILLGIPFANKVTPYVLDKENKKEEAE